MALPAEVIQIGERMGIKGVSRARCRILDGRDKGKVVVRNIVGPLRLGDIIMLKETGMDAESKFASRK